MVQTQTIPYYHATGREEEVFTHAFRNKIPFLLKGPTGTGKSRFIEYMAHQLDQRIITISCHEETSATDLIGRFIIKGAETVWLDGPLTTAVKEGAIIYLDEVAEARPDVIVAIHSLTDHRRELFIDKLGETVKAHDNFMLVASFNPGYQRGFKELKPSTRQRFIAVSFEYPEPRVETEILVNETQVNAEIAKKTGEHRKQNPKPDGIGLNRNRFHPIVSGCRQINSQRITETIVCTHSRCGTVGPFSKKGILFLNACVKTSSSLPVA